MVLPNKYEHVYVRKTKQFTHDSVDRRKPNIIDYTKINY